MPALGLLLDPGLDGPREAIVRCDCGEEAIGDGDDEDVEVAEDEARRLMLAAVMIAAWLCDYCSFVGLLAGAVRIFHAVVQRTSGDRPVPSADHAGPGTVHVQVENHAISGSAISDSLALVAAGSSTGYEPVTSSAGHTALAANSTEDEDSPTPKAHLPASQGQAATVKPHPLLDPATRYNDLRMQQPASSDRQIAANQDLQAQLDAAWVSHRASQAQINAAQGAHVALQGQIKAAESAHQASLEQLDAALIAKQASQAEVSAAQGAQLALEAQTKAAEAAYEASLELLNAAQDAHPASLAQRMVAVLAARASLQQLLAALGAQRTSMKQLSAAKDAQLASQAQLNAAQDAHMASQAQLRVALGAQRASMEQLIAAQVAHQTSLEQLNAVKDAQLASHAQLNAAHVANPGTYVACLVAKQELIAQQAAAKNALIVVKDCLTAGGGAGSRA